MAGAGGPQGGAGRRDAPVRLTVADALGGTPHPLRSRQELALVFHLHLEVVELPVPLALEEVRFTIFPLENAVYVVSDSLPHGHVSWVVQLNVAFLFIKLPIHVSAVEVRFPVVAPNHRRVETVQALRQAEFY